MRQFDIVKREIPDTFYPCIANECAKIFGGDILARDEDGISNLNYIGGTAGWNTAFKRACENLDIQWLYDYYNKLSWWDSDLFDDNIINEIEEMLYVD